MREPLNVSLWDVMNVTQFCAVGDMTVTRVEGRDVEEFCRRWHYTMTKGAANWRYGLWDGFTLVGVVAYNIPTNEACGQVFGLRGDPTVLHMGRLVCAEDAPRNSESRLIAGSLKMLHRDTGARAVLTYAAQDQGHVGYVYQATNALYTGTGGDSRRFLREDGSSVSTNANRTAINITAESLAAEGVTVHKSLPKHRYVYLLGSKTQRKESRRLLRLPVLPYPKADSAGVAP